MEYKNYFWDFDGTLYNSYPGMVRAFVETLKTQEIELDSKEVYKIMREASVRKAFKLYGPTSVIWTSISVWKPSK